MAGNIGNVTSSGVTGGSGAVGGINPFKTIGAAADALTGFLPQTTESQGDYGALSQGLDAAYNGIADAAMGIPPVGTMIGGIMKVGGFLTKGLNALGAGTDGMTAADAVLGSPFFALTPFGLLNGLAGKKADTFTKDSEVFAQMGNSYAGTEGQADVAARKSGKKYGLFSLGAMQDANRMMRKTQQAQDDIRNIQDTTNTQNLLAASMSQANNNAYANRLQGGYQQSLIRSAKQGAILQDVKSLQRAKLFAKKGTKLSLNKWPDYIIEDKQFVKFLETCPIEIKDFNEDNEILYDIWRTNGKPNNIDEANNSLISMFVEDEYGKYTINPEILYYTQLAEDDFAISTSEESDLNGVDKLDDSTPVEIQEDTQLFKSGGQLNVIPEGALHAHKHHLEQVNEDLKGNITHKGIPVVAVDEDGNIEQQAEVERNELILNKETTDAIEELRKKYHEAKDIQEKQHIAEEAGQIFATSLIENTDDRTNLMDSI